MRNYANSFITNLKDMFMKLNKKELTITYWLAPRKKAAGAKSATSKIKGKDEEGFKE